MGTHRVTAKAVAMAALLLGGSLALAPEAQAYRGLNGLTQNGAMLQGRNLNGREVNGSQLQGRPTRGDTAELGALQVRAVRLPDGRTLHPRRR